MTLAVSARPSQYFAVVLKVVVVSILMFSLHHLPRWRGFFVLFIVVLIIEALLIVVEILIVVFVLILFLVHKVILVGLGMGIEVVLFLILILVVIVRRGRGMLLLVLVVGVLDFLQALALRVFRGFLGSRGDLGLRCLPEGWAASLCPHNCRQNRFSSSSGFV
jgi:hypothetical protein